MRLKKSLSILLVLLLSMNVMFIPSIAYDDIQDSNNVEAIETLAGLGILSGYDSGSFLPDSKITRAEFAVIITKITGFEAENNTAVVSTSFNDVEPTYWANNYINYVNSMSFMIGSDSAFRPEDNITVDEVIKVLVEVLGYGYKAQMMGYPDGYRSQSSELGIYTKVASKFTEPASRGEVAQMAYNCIDIKIYKRSIFGGDKVTYTQGDNLLKEYLKIDTIKGTVIEDYLSGITGPSYLNDGKFKIKTTKSEDIYLIAGNDKYSTDYLGSAVIAYTKVNDIDENELQYIKLNKQANKALRVTQDQLIQYTNGKLIYNLSPDKSGNDKSVNVLPSLDIVYNGVYYDGDKEKIMNISSGYIDLDDTDNDGLYDLAKIQEKEYIVVESVDGDSGIVIDKYSSDNSLEIDVDDIDNIIQVSKFGLDMTIASLDTGDVVEVIRSKNESGRKLYKLTVIDNQISGQISSVGEESIWIGDKEYKLSSYYTKNKKEIGAFQSGINTTFVLDSDNRVMLCADTVSTYLYGYFVEVEQESALSDVTVRIFTSSGKMTDFKLAGSLLLDGKTKASVDDIIMNLGVAKFGVPAPDENLGQLIRYKTNKANEIVGLDTGCENIGSNAEQDQDQLTKDKKGSLKWLSGPKSFDGVLVDDSAVLFGIPADSKKYNKYMIYKPASLPNSTYEVNLYNVSDIGVAKAAVVIGDSIAEIENDDPVYIVQKLVTTVNGSGDIVKKMYAIENKSSSVKEYMFTEDSKVFEYASLPLTNPNDATDSTPYQIKAGDVVRLIIDGTNVRKLERLFSVEHFKKNVASTSTASKFPGEITSGGTANLDYSYLLRFITGKLMTRQDRYIKISIVNPAGNVPKELSYFLQDTCKFSVYTENSSGSVSVKSATIGDLKDDKSSGSKASYIFAKSRYGVIQDVFIYNFNTDPWAE